MTQQQVGLIYQARDLGGTKKAARPSFYERFGKRAFDLVCATSLIVLGAPLMIGVWLFLFLSGGNAIFGHARIGRYHRRFECYKFRTMRKDSARVLRFVLRTDRFAAEEWADEQKLSKDPRITGAGRFLRATSFDELPQLFNVLRGEMSMVGPRPVTDKELFRYGDKLPLYLSVRPGLTGPWQIHGRGTTSYSQRVAMDCSYVENMSFLTDLKLVCQTVMVVLKRSGT